MVDSSDELLSVAEVARYLGISPHTVYRWIATGRLPALRFSNKVIRIRRSDLGALSGSVSMGVAEAKAPYQVGPIVDAADYERQRKNFKHLLEIYHEIQNRPRSADDPPKGSPAALLRHVGKVSHEDAEELRRVIREAKTYSPPPDL